jgi:hypothetical protein
MAENASVSTLPQLLQWVSNLISNPKPVAADSFFQTRITHTPGGAESLDPSIVGAYDPTADPIAKVKASNLPEDVKSKLIDQWKQLGKGYIRAPQSTLRGRPDVLRHEQVHALEQKAGLGQHEADIASRISPKVVRYLENEPVYQREAQALGKQKVRAAEGLAVDLTDTSIPVNTALQKYVSGILGPRERRQLQQLSTR